MYLYLYEMQTVKSVKSVIFYGVYDSFTVHRNGENRCGTRVCGMPLRFLRIIW